MQHESVVMEDDVVHYSIYVDEYINSGKDANTDDLRAILIDSLAFMYVHMFTHIAHPALHALISFPVQMYRSVTFGKRTAFHYPCALIMKFGTFTGQAVLATISKTSGSSPGFFCK